LDEKEEDRGGEEVPGNAAIVDEGAAKNKMEDETMVNGVCT
jgi:hypothetical protein